MLHPLNPLGMPGLGSSLLPRTRVGLTLIQSTINYYSWLGDLRETFCRSGDVFGTSAILAQQDDMILQAYATPGLKTFRWTKNLVARS
jgi:hypothetical protein